VDLQVVGLRESTMERSSAHGFILWGLSGVSASRDRGS
jgi:hypothetical protein